MHGNSGNQHPNSTDMFITFKSKSSTMTFFTTGAGCVMNFVNIRDLFCEINEKERSLTFDAFDVSVCESVAPKRMDRF